MSAQLDLKALAAAAGAKQMAMAEPAVAEGPRATWRHQPAGSG
ncbi:MAG: hypothetical protein R2749_29035 [Acidimicrobiales bacterium]